jgi:hypothetical protein
MTLQTRAAELIAQGYYVAPARLYTLLTPGIDPRKTPYTADEAGRGPDLNICLGAMRTGRYAYKLDLDTHNENQNADTARAGLKSARPELEAKIDWHRSRGQKGWHGYFISTKRLDTGKLYDAAGNHIGELLGADSDRTLDPGTLNPPTLHSGEVERLLNVWHIKGSDPKGERWADRAKQGERWARGYQYIPVTRQQLRTFLQNEAGPVGKQLDTYFDQRQPFNRSDKAGSLMQNLMFFARKLPGCANASFTTRCANVMAYWMAAKSFGKADDTDYSQEKDGWSLIAQIVNQDPYGEGQHWKCPSWVDSTTATAAPATPPARAAHRPAGDRNKHLVTFRRVLEAIEPDDFGRRTYTLEQLAERMKIARCAVAPRTIQNYLRDLRENGEIVTAQIGGNGIPYAVLKPCFGGANNYEKRVETDAKPDNFGGANEIAEQGILTPQSVETPPVCIVDHQDTCAPTSEPGGAAYVPGADWTAGGRLDLSGWRDPSEIRIPSEWIDRTPPPRHFRQRQPRQKGQRTIEAEMREPMADRQARDLDARIERLTANIAHAEAAGQQPAKRAERLAELRAQRDKGYASAPLIPTPYRPRAALLPLEDLPEPPAVAAPAGAQSAGAPLPGPQAGVTPAQLMAERRRRRETQQVQP